MEKNDLYARLAERIGLKGSERIANLFRMITDEKEAELMLATPGTAEELAQKTNRGIEEIEESLADLFHRGLMFMSEKPQGTKYGMCRNLIQFHDATILWKEVPRPYLDAWQEFMENEWPGLAAAIDKSGIRPFFRVIAVDQTIQGGTKVLPYDTAKKILENAKTIAVTDCTCRKIAHKCDKPLEVCIQLGKGAEYAIKRGTGKELTREEALEILKKTEEEGLVHCTENKAGIGNVICNCCSCCCQIMPMVIEHGRRLLDPSRFKAEIDPDLCTACETCVDRCIFNAVEMNGDAAKVIAEKCLGCGLCTTTCPAEAIELVEVREEDFIPESMHL